jgi:hypothetical protein
MVSFPAALKLFKNIACHSNSFMFSDASKLTVGDIIIKIKAINIEKIIKKRLYFLIIINLSYVEQEDQNH